MKNKILLGGLLCLGLLISSCHKYDWDDISHIGANDKILICKDGEEKRVKAKHIEHWIDKGCTELLDLDGDHYYGYDGPDNSCGYLRDCDDGNPNINPGVEEICDDALDNNCNMATDEGCANCDKYQGLIDSLLPEDLVPTDLVSAQIQTRIGEGGELDFKRYTLSFLFQEEGKDNKTKFVFNVNIVNDPALGFSATSIFVLPANSPIPDFFEVNDDYTDAELNICADILMELAAKYGFEFTEVEV